MLTRKMKDSGIEWIGEIPEDWDVVQVKHLFEIGRGRVISKEELKFDSQTGYPVYSSQTKNDGVLGYIGTYDFDEPQLTWTTDGANAGTVFLRKGKYNCTNVCGTLKLKSDIQDKISLDYVYHALYVGAPYYKRKDTNGYKIMNNEMAVIKISLPPLDMQEKVSKEIKGKVKIFHDLIGKTNQSIEELKKYKQSLITEAVTKGLDPNVEMKDSGIEWIGEIPSDWIIKKTRYFLMETSIKNHPDEEVLSLYRDYGVVPKNSRDDNHNVTSANTSNYKFVRKNDVVINKMKAWQGSIAISEYKGIVSPAYYTFEVTDKEIEFKFLHYALRNNLYLDEYMRLSAGLRVGQWDLNKNEFKNILYPFPNSISEQRQIVSYLDEQTSRIDKLIEDKTKVIEELEDYKKSLIYEYVTGKKEV